MEPSATGREVTPVILGVSLRRLLSTAALFGALAALVAACSSESPTPEPTATPTVPPTATPTLVPTATPAAVPIATPPIATATPALTATPTPEPTATATLAPTATPTPEPTATPTLVPTATPTATPSPPYAAVWLTLREGPQLDSSNPDAAAAIKALPWVADGIEEDERRGLLELLRTALGFMEVFNVLVAQPWIEDGVNGTERAVMAHLASIARTDEAAALRILSMPFLETVEDEDGATMESLRRLASLFPGQFQRAVPWVEDGLDESERTVISLLRAIRARDHAAAQRILELPFLETVERADALAVEALRDAADRSTRALRAVLEKPWVEDGLDESERIVAIRVTEIATKDQAAALRILEMPFLETVDAVDAGAMGLLWHLASRQPHLFQEVLEHPGLSVGISDEWAKVVMTLGDLSDSNPDRMFLLLDQGPGAVEEEVRTIGLPLAGEVVLTIIRTGPGSPRSMDVLERTVRNAESFMGLPFPAASVLLFFKEEGFGAGHTGTHIVFPARLDGQEPERFVNSWARELARYYWRGHAAWIEQGAATVMMPITEDGRAGAPRLAISYPCPELRSIADLEASDPYALTTRKCNFSLGGRFFLDLYYTLGDTAFREGFRSLYLMSEAGQIGIDEIREAFKAGAPDRGILVDTVVGRWYDGTEEYDTSHLDRGPVDPDLPGINGRIEGAYLALFQGGPPIFGFSGSDVAGPVWLTIDYSHPTDSGLHETQLEIVEFFEDGFMFRRREVTLRTTLGYSGSSHHIEVGYTGIGRSAGTEPGKYWVYVYDEGRKVAEVEYEVTE